MRKYTNLANGYEAKTSQDDLRSRLKGAHHWQARTPQSRLSRRTPTTMPPHVDLVILFSARVPASNKAQAKENIQEAEEQYKRLINLLKTSGLHVVGKRGEKLGELMILIKCPQQKLDELARAERFVHYFPLRVLSLGLGVVLVHVGVITNL